MKAVQLNKETIDTIKEKSKEKRSFVREFLHRRQHPIKIIGYTSKTLWLLLIPIVKNIITLEFDIQGWIRTHWLDGIIISFIVGFAVFRWMFVYYRIEEDGIEAHFGPFGIIRTKVYFSEITTFSTNQGYLYRAVGACTMYIETNADSVPRTDMKLVLSDKSVKEIYEIVSARSNKQPSFSVAPRKRHLAVFSLLFSSPISGIILFMTFIYELYRLVGQEMEKQLFSTVNGKIVQIDSATLGLFRAVPGTIAMIGGVIAGGWLLSFITNMLSYWKFTSARRGRQFFIASGFIRRKRSILNRDRVNYFDVRRTLMMRLFHISSVHICCTGYGVRKSETSALIPITTDREMEASLKILEPSLVQAPPEIHTGKRDLGRFLTLPLIMCAVPIAAGTFMKYLIDRWHSEINILMVVMTLPLLWQVIIKLVAAFTTSVGMKHDVCTLCYCRDSMYHTVSIPKKNVSKLRIKQNVFQRKSRTCTLYIYTDSERRRVHRIMGLPAEATRNMCIREGFSV